MIIYSGGADGTDSIAEDMAERLFLHFHFFSFEEHYTCCNKSFRIKLTTKELREAIPYLYKTSELIHRSYPSIKKYTNKLLQRDYHIVKNVETVFAFGIVQYDQVKGGTGWGVCMAGLLKKIVYIFDIQKKIWYLYNNKHFEPVNTIPFNIEKNIAIIGTRQTDGFETIIRDEIEKIFKSVLRK